MGRPAESPGGRTGGPTAMTGGPDTELPLVARISRHLAGLGAWGWLSHQDAAPQSSTLLREGDARSSRAVGTGAGSHSRDRLERSAPTGRHRSRHAARRCGPARAFGTPPFRAEHIRGFGALRQSLWRHSGTARRAGPGIYRVYCQAIWAPFQGCPDLRTAFA